MRIFIFLSFALSAHVNGDMQGAEAYLKAEAVAYTHINDLQPIIGDMSTRRLVLLGEGSHGTHEFYTLRAAISRELISSHGFNFIAVEGDWSALLPLDRYVRHLPDSPDSAREALLQIDRWPLWMWANEEMVELGEWLHEINRDRPPSERVGIHGVDIYGFWDSLNAVVEFYDSNLPELAAEIRRLYVPLKQFYRDNSGYVRSIYLLNPSAESEVRRVAEKLRKRYQNSPPEQRSAVFKAKQHALVVKSAEKHLRNNTRAGPHSWNARAIHFEETVSRLLDYYGDSSRGIVWAHNTHVGDARATAMAIRGEVNIGQLARERHGHDPLYILGFGTGSGAVLAAAAWEDPVQPMRIPSPPETTLEGRLLRMQAGDRYWRFTHGTPNIDFPHRAIGVLYNPAFEHRGNFVPTRLNQRYDAFIFLETTKALTPLHP